MNTLTPITHKRSTASAALRFLIHGVQPTGALVATDLSGNGNHGAIYPGTAGATSGFASAAAADAAMFANAGWITSTANSLTDGGATVGGSGASAVGGFNLYAGESFILLATVNMAYPGYGTSVVGNNTNTSGVTLGASSTNSGGFGVAIRDNSGNVYDAGLKPTLKLADGNTHKVVCYVNGNSSAIGDTGGWRMRVGFDGVEQTLADVGYGVGVYRNTGAGVTGSTLPSYGFGIGHCGNPGTSGTAPARIRDVHLYVLPAGVGPAKFADVIRWYQVNPDKPLPASIVGY